MSQVWTPDSEQEPHIVRRIGLRGAERPDGGLDAQTTIGASLRGPTGLPLLGVLGSFADTVGGVRAALHSYPVALATADLGITIDPGLRPEEVHTTPVVVRAGRTSVVTEMVLTDAVASVCGYATMTSSLLSDRAPQQFDPKLVFSYTEGVVSDGTPLYEQIGLEAGPGLGADGGPGARVYLADHLGNTLGMMHGGVTVMIADAATMAVARARWKTERVATVDAHVRYLNGARVGPVVATTTVMAGDDHSVSVRVEQRDRGADDRLTAIATTRAVRVDT